MGQYRCWTEPEVRSYDINSVDQEWLTRDVKPLLEALGKRGKGVEEILNIIVWDTPSPCWRHNPARYTVRAGAGSCTSCAQKCEAYKIPMDELKTKLADMLDQIRQHSLEREASAKKREWTTHRDTGRPKRSGITDRYISYAETDAMDNTFSEAGQED